MGFSLLLLPLSATGQTDAPEGGNLEDLTLEETLAVPEVPTKYKEYIKSYMKREARALQNLGYKVETMRRGEVVIVSVPAEKLFAPNATVLMAQAGSELDHFLPYFRTRGKFKVILAMHSDDTGADEYLQELTEKRIVALYEYFDRNATQTDQLQGYPMADNAPVAENNSRKGREANRRLEVYLVPGDLLIVDAKGKKL